MTYPPGDTPPERPEDQPAAEDEAGAEETRADETREVRAEEPRPEQRPGHAEPPPGYAGQPRPPWEQPQQRPGPPPYGYPPGPPGPMPYVPDHPKTTMVLVLGILGVVVCQVLAPFAWVIGKRTLDEIDASQGRWGGRTATQAGYVLGIVGTILLGLGLALLVVYVIIMALVVGGGLASAT